MPYINGEALRHREYTFAPVRAIGQICWADGEALLLLLRRLSRVVFVRSLGRHVVRGNYLGLLCFGVEAQKFVKRTATHGKSSPSL
jgi:hypothetical protein